MIKITTIATLIFVLKLGLQAQISTDIKSTVTGYPKSISTYKKLAGFINRDFDNDHDKAAAIYVWIAENISYDVKAFLKKKKSYKFTYQTLEEKELKEKELQEKLVRATFKNKKAVCEGYSTLYKYLGDLTGVTCKIVSGDSKTMLSDIGRIPNRSLHAWNVVKIGDIWHLVDATWGAGSVDFSKKKFIKDYRDTYFFAKPDMFFLKHFPENTDWLLTNKTKTDFAKLPLYHSIFIDLGLDLLQPTNGIITKAPNKKIKFKIKNAKNLTDLSYAFSGAKYATKLITEKKGDYILFEIPTGHKKSGYLTIYYKNEALISFKLAI